MRTKIFNSDVDKMNYAIAINDSSTAGAAFNNRGDREAYAVIFEFAKREGLNKVIELKYREKDIFLYISDLRFNNIDGVNLLKRVKKEKKPDFIVLTSEHFNSCMPDSREIGVSCWSADSDGAEEN